MIISIMVSGIIIYNIARNANTLTIVITWNSVFVLIFVCVWVVVVTFTLCKTIVRHRLACQIDDNGFFCVECCIRVMPKDLLVHCLKWVTPMKS